jgi:hypothetical protein
MCHEYEALEFRDGEAVEVPLYLTGIVTQLGALGEPISKEAVVCKFLRTTLEKFDQLVMSIETCLEMEVFTIEDVTGRLKAGEECFASRAARTTTSSGTSTKLLLTQEEWEARSKKMAAGVGSSAPPQGGGGGGAKQKGKFKKKGGKGGPEGHLP